MRKQRRLTLEELAPYQWQLPRHPIAQKTQLPTSDTQQPQTNVDLPVHQQPLDWTQLFGNTHPVEIEVGIGKGLFLLNSAIARPETNFFGIEVVRKYQLYATTRIAIRKLTNVKTVCADARWVFRQFVPSASVAAVHVYFPDPWWKARHKKRRVFTAEFAYDVARALQTCGRLHIATDVEEYFEVMTGIINSSPAFRVLWRMNSTGSIEDTGYETNFERKARQKGTPVWRAVFERTEQQITQTCLQLS